MVVRELKDGRFLVSTQEDHADVAAQFAAHWGNERFAKLRPYQTMLLATTHHDSGYREWEGNPPMNMEKGRPYAFREEIPAFESVELSGYVKNVDWVSSHDLYAGLLVSTHRLMAQSLQRLHQAGDEAAGKKQRHSGDQKTTGRQAGAN